MCCGSELWETEYTNLFGDIISQQALISRCLLNARLCTKHRVLVRWLTCTVGSAILGGGASVEGRSSGVFGVIQVLWDI